MSQARIIPVNEYLRTRWKNGQGWTREILRVPDQDGWEWRVSIAEIEQDAAFSSFPGIDRELILLQGNGVRLEFADGEQVELEPPHGRIRFAGEREVVGKLRDGTTHDFNLMWRRDVVEAELLHRPLVGPMLFFVDADTTWVIHLLAGQARFEADTDLAPMFAGDTALLPAQPGRHRFALQGGGELLAARITPVKRADIADQ